MQSNNHWGGACDKNIFVYGLLMILNKVVTGRLFIIFGERSIMP